MPSSVSGKLRSRTNFIQCSQISACRNPLPTHHFLPTRLPYVADMNAAMGMVAKHYLENTVKEDSNAKALEATEKVYSIAVNLNKDLNKGFDFWDHVMKGIKVLKEAKSFEETCNMFLEADAWLTPRRLP